MGCHPPSGVDVGADLELTVKGGEGLVAPDPFSKTNPATPTTTEMRIDSKQLGKSICIHSISRRIDLQEAAGEDKKELRRRELPKAPFCGTK
jgi:hypothetical protein